MSFEGCLFVEGFFLNFFQNIAFLNFYSHSVISYSHLRKYKDTNLATRRHQGLIGIYLSIIFFPSAPQKRKN